MVQYLRMVLPEKSRMEQFARWGEVSGENSAWDISAFLSFAEVAIVWFFWAVAPMLRIRVYVELARHDLARSSDSDTPTGCGSPRRPGDFWEPWGRAPFCLRAGV